MGRTDNSSTSMMRILKISFFITTTLLVFGQCIHDKFIDVSSYDGYQVISVIPRTIEDFEMLKTLDDHPYLDFWTEIGLNRPVDIMVVPHFRFDFVEILKNQGMENSVMIPNVQYLIDQERAAGEEIRRNMKDNRQMTWTDYYNASEINKWMDELADMYDFAETEIIGQSYEGRDLKIIKICKGGCGNKPAIWLDGGIHAREWIAPAATTYAINELTTNNANHTYLLDNLDWYLLPSHNPDGYQFTIDHARLWRKTRSDSGSLFGCRGTDANRNFGFHWNTGGASNDKCYDTYHGSEAFSEVEAQAVRDYILQLNGTIQYYNSQHSYSQLILLPWAWTSEPPDNSFELLKAAGIGNDALKKVHGTHYEVGCIPCLLYIASGSSADWALGIAGIPYAYSVELRDTGRYGFLLPRDLILPTAEEIWAFHDAVARYIIEIQ